MTLLRSVPMVHLRVQVPNRDAAVATRAIASEGLLHLVDIAHGHAPFDASPPGVRELYAAFRDLVRRIQAIADRLGIRREELNGAIDGDDITDFDIERERILLVLEPPWLAAFQTTSPRDSRLKVRPCSFTLPAKTRPQEDAHEKTSARRRPKGALSVERGALAGGAGRNCRGCSWRVRLKLCATSRTTQASRSARTYR